MKINGFIVLGIALLLMGAFSGLQIVDTSKPEYELSLMVPQKDGDYTKLDYVRLACRDRESGIKKVEFSVWQTGEPATQVLLQYNCTIGPPMDNDTEPLPEPPTEPVLVAVTFFCYYYQEDNPMSSVKVRLYLPDASETKLTGSDGKAIFTDVPCSAEEDTYYVWKADMAPVSIRDRVKLTGEDAEVKVNMWEPGMPLQIIDETWEIWEITLDPAITEEGDYTFHFQFYNEAELWNEIPAPSTFSIVSSTEDPTAEDSSQEQGNYDETGDYGPLPDGTTYKPSPYTGWEIPAIFVFVGGTTIVYGMIKEKKKGI